LLVITINLNNFATHLVVPRDTPKCRDTPVGNPWSILTRDEVLRLHNTPPLVGILVGWSEGQSRLWRWHISTNPHGIATHKTYIDIGYKNKLSKAVPLHAMEAHGGRGGKAPLTLNLGTRWGRVVSITSRPRFTPGERTPGTHWTGGWVVPRAGLDAETRRKILGLCRGSNPGRPVGSQSPYWLSYPGSEKGYSLVQGFSHFFTGVPLNEI
jgi:hypothetical protein